MAVRATIDWLADRDSSPWMDRILKINPTYGEAYATAGRFFVLNRRYEEGIRFYRKAVELQPRLWSAHSELGVNLMRLAEDEEARRHLVLAYENGYRDSATVNSLRLLDSYKNFVFLKSGDADSQTRQEGSRAATALLRSRAEARHADLRTEVRPQAGAPGAG